MSWKAAVAAGGAFSGALIAGTVGGVLLARQSDAPLWIPAGLFAGLAVGVLGVVAALRGRARPRP